MFDPDGLAGAGGIGRFKANSHHNLCGSQGTGFVHSRGVFAMLPVKKISKTRTRTRRAHHALQPTTLCGCPKCGKPKLPHCACSVCGYVSEKVSLQIAEKEG